MMQDNTKIGGSSQFPVTRLSHLELARSGDAEQRRQAFEAIIQAYWQPVYKTIRVKWHKSNEDAKDLTQAFFTTVLEKDYFASYQPEKARFRTFLRTCLHGFVSNSEKASKRLKRGGENRPLSVDFSEAESEIAFTLKSDVQPVDKYFDQEWVRHLFSLAVSDLQNHFDRDGKQHHFLLFQRYDLNLEPEKPTYNDLATELNLPVTKVTNYLAEARRAFRAILLQNLRLITASESEFQSEAAALLGVSERRS